MAKKRQRKGFFRSMVDFKTWMSMDSIKSTGENIGEAINDLKNVNLTNRVETFEEAVARLSLDEASITKRRRQCLYSAWVYLVFALGLVGYSIYLILSDHILSFFITLIFALIAGLSAYREAFWYYQMTIKKLGCTPREFFMYLIGRK